MIIFKGNTKNIKYYNESKKNERLKLNYLLRKIILTNVDT
jgi:hypothetical protein